MKTISEFAPEKSGTKWLTLRAVFISLVSGRTGPAGSGRRWNALAKLPRTRVLFEIRVSREQLEQRMKLPSACLILTACTVAWSATAYAQTTQPVVKFPTEIEFKAPLSPGSQTAVLYGDPAKPGVYVQRTKFPAGTKVMPH
jgi:hypothetical protein